MWPNPSLQDIADINITVHNKNIFRTVLIKKHSGMFLTGSSLVFSLKVEILFSDLSISIVVIYLKYSMTF